MAVIILVVEAMARRVSAFFSKSTVPLSRLMRMAEGALTAGDEVVFVDRPVARTVRVAPVFGSPRNPDETVTPEDDGVSGSSTNLEEPGLRKARDTATTTPTRTTRTARAKSRCRH
jgi:hypothetical protein